MDSHHKGPVMRKITSMSWCHHSHPLPGTALIRLQIFLPWWRHQMETFSALLAICAGNSPVNYPHKGQWRGALMFSLIRTWINGWVNNLKAGDLRRNRAHYEVSVMQIDSATSCMQSSILQHPPILEPNCYQCQRFHLCPCLFCQTFFEYCSHSC